jgi:hypothetical protein
MNLPPCTPVGLPGLTQFGLPQTQPFLPNQALCCSLLEQQRLQFLASCPFYYNGTIDPEETTVVKAILSVAKKKFPALRNHAEAMYSCLETFNKAGIIGIFDQFCTTSFRLRMERLAIKYHFNKSSNVFGNQIDSNMKYIIRKVLEEIFAGLAEHEHGDKYDALKLHAHTSWIGAVAGMTSYGYNQQRGHFIKHSLLPRGNQLRSCSLFLAIEAIARNDGDSFDILASLFDCGILERYDQWTHTNFLSRIKWFADIDRQFGSLPPCLFWQVDGDKCEMLKATLKAVFNIVLGPRFVEDSVFKSSQEVKTKQHSSANIGDLTAREGKTTTLPLEVAHDDDDNPKLKQCSTVTTANDTHSEADCHLIVEVEARPSCVKSEAGVNDNSEKRSDWPLKDGCGLQDGVSDTEPLQNNLGSESFQDGVDSTNNRSSRSLAIESAGSRRKNEAAGRERLDSKAAHESFSLGHGTSEQIAKGQGFPAIATSNSVREEGGAEAGRTTRVRDDSNSNGLPRVSYFWKNSEPRKTNKSIRISQGSEAKVQASSQSLGKRKHMELFEEQRKCEQKRIKPQMMHPGGRRGPTDSQSTAAPTMKLNSRANENIPTELWDEMDWQAWDTVHL